jgi:hypothetical protein
MSKINNIVNDIKDDLSMAGQTLAMGAMITGTLLGVVDVSHDTARRAIINQQPVYAFAGQGTDDSNQLRRERDEVGQHYISYAEAQRTPSRSGKR